MRQRSGTYPQAMTLGSLGSDPRDPRIGRPRTPFGHEPRIVFQYARSSLSVRTSRGRAVAGSFPFLEQTSRKRCFQRASKSRSFALSTSTVIWGLKEGGMISEVSTYVEYPGRREPLPASRPVSDSRRRSPMFSSKMFSLHRAATPCPAKDGSVAARFSLRPRSRFSTPSALERGSTASRIGKAQCLAESPVDDVTTPAAVQPRPGRRLRDPR